jgi:THO complex subunit 2
MGKGLPSMTHADFTEVYNKWHAGLGAAFIGCLKSSEYMHTRTALIIMSKMVDFFPTKSTLGEKLLEALAPLQEDSNPMQDIKAMAQGYSSKIIMARDTGRWKEECSKITKAREDKEKKMQQDRKKNAKKQLAEMEKEMANSANQSSDTRQDRKPHDRRGAARFTPAQKKSGDVAPQSHGDRNGERNGRVQDSRSHKEQNTSRRNEPRSSDRGSGPQERWERNGSDGKGIKRGRSPDGKKGAPDRGRPSDRDRGRRGDVTPPLRTRARTSRR